MSQRPMPSQHIPPIPHSGRAEHDARAWYTRYETDHARHGYRMHEQRPRLVPEDVEQPVAPTANGIVGAALSILRWLR